MNKPCTHCGWPLLTWDLKNGSRRHRNCIRLQAKGKQPKRRPVERMIRATEARTLRTDATAFEVSMTDTKEAA